MEEIIFSYPKLKERMNGKEKETKLARRYLSEIKAEFSETTMNTLVKFMDLVVGRLYDGMYFDSVGQLNFKKLVNDANVVLVPNHQSHADYVALNYLIFKNFSFSMFVAGGINLNFFLIGKLFRKCGCFFIRRTFTADPIYKLTLEAYLYYLLREGKPIEFFFEGGRSRTGKLLEPRLGLYQLILEAYDSIPKDIRRPLCFVPVSIVHEYVPEQRTLLKESEGRAKEKESFSQIFKLIKLFTREFGNIHIKLGNPIYPRMKPDLKLMASNLALDCFRMVSKNLTMTPSSLLALVLLDEPAGALKMEDIHSRAERIVEFCNYMQIPLSDGLGKDRLRDSLERMIDIFIANGKIEVIGRTRFGHVFYFIKEEARKEMLYLKNVVIHHFLSPWLINSVWLGIFSGSMKTPEDLRTFFLNQQNHLKLEFYLPAMRDFFRQVLAILTFALGRPVKSVKECLNFPNQDMYTIVMKLGMFSRVCSYIYEGYYLTCMTIKALTADKEYSFRMDDFNRVFIEVYDFELEHGRIIKYSESASNILTKNCLKLLTAEGIIENDLGTYKITEEKKIKLDQLIASYHKTLKDQLIFNMRVL